MFVGLVIIELVIFKVRISEHWQNIIAVLFINKKVLDVVVLLNEFTTKHLLFFCLHRK